MINRPFPELNISDEDSVSIIERAPLATLGNKCNINNNELNKEQIKLIEEIEVLLQKLKKLS